MKKLKEEFISKNTRNRLYQIPVPIIGLTGGIATGKSTVSKYLREKGFAIIDADQLVKTIYQKPESLVFVKTHFPTAITKEGQINFKVLREIAFAYEDEKAKIEKFIYQYMPEEFKRSYLQLKNPEFVIYDVPLLFEKHLNELVDISICVYCPKELQIKRLMERDSIDNELAEKILATQLDIEEKKKIADKVIRNTKTNDDLLDIVDSLLAEITF